MRRLPVAGPVALALSVAGAACASAPPAGPPPAARWSTAALVNRPFEVAVPLRAWPVDPGARAEIEAPSGGLTTVLAFRRGDALAARFRPAEAGEHRWRLVVGEGDGARVLSQGRIEVDDLGDDGGVRVRGPALLDARGRIFRALGESRPAHEAARTDAPPVEAEVRRMAGGGMNTLRVLVPAACGTPGARAVAGCLEPRLGEFDEAAAERYDELFAAAERHGVQVILAVFAAGFTPGDARRGWEANPYSAARGGPARTPQDFFRAPAARDAARRRLRYVLARWGASPALLAVDLLDEPERDGTVPESAWIPWAEELARTWRRHDPYARAVTLGSAGLHRNVEHDERPWWESPACDVVQWHRDGEDPRDVHALARALVSTVRETARHGKPVLIGALGGGGSPVQRLEHAHVGLWAATFAGAGVLVRAPPAAEEDAAAALARAARLRVLATFLRRADPNGALARAAEGDVSIKGARALVLAGELTSAAWVHAPAPGYGAPVSGLTITIPGLATGRWRATWVDDVTGRELAAADVQVSGVWGLTLPVPTFTRHVALLLERLVR